MVNTPSPSGLSDRIDSFLSNIDAVSKEAHVQDFLDSYPDISNGRTLGEIVRDDIIEFIEDFSSITKQQSKQTRDLSTSLSIYKNLLNERENTTISELSARTRLNEAKAKSQNGIPALSIPLFVQMTIPSDIDMEFITEWEEDWLGITSAIALSINNAYANALHEKYEEIFTNYVDRATQKYESVNRQQGASSSENTPPENKALTRIGIDPELQKYFEFFGEDITTKAETGDYVETIGRDKEVNQTLAALIKKENPHALLYGKKGVGVSSVTRGLAQRINEGKVPADLKEARVIRLKLREMKAWDGNGQARYPVTGDPIGIKLFTYHLYTILRKTAAHNANGGPKIILNLDELEDMAERIPIFQAKNVMSAIMDSTNDLLLVSEITEEEKFALESEIADFTGLFQDVHIEPLSRELTLTILKNEAAKRNQEDGVHITDGVLERTIKIADKYVSNTARPQNALETLDAAIAQAAIEGTKKITLDHIGDVISARKHVPKEVVLSKESEQIAKLKEELPKRVLGQDEHLQAIATKLKTSQKGWSKDKKKKPMGSFLMPGNTGVGKTETAKALSDLLGMKLIRIDMANFKDQHAKAKLIGSPPGYVGFGGVAEFKKVKENPYSVLLLDEIEKAHGDVFNVLLSILDEGEVQLMDGSTVDFTQCVILMTSNLGTKEAALKSGGGRLGFSGVNTDDPTTSPSKEAMKQAVEGGLPPEFINRIDDILYYNDLTRDVVEKIALLKVRDVSDVLRDKNKYLTLTISEEAVKELGEIGYNPALGARPMERAITNKIITPLDDWFDATGELIKEPTEIHIKSLKDEFNIEVRKSSNDNNADAAPSKQISPPKRGLSGGPS